MCTMYIDLDAIHVPCVCVCGLDPETKNSKAQKESEYKYTPYMWYNCTIVHSPWSFVCSEKSYGIYSLYLQLNVNSKLN